MPSLRRPILVSLVSLLGVSLGPENALRKMGGGLGTLVSEAPRAQRGSARDEPPQRDGRSIRRPLGIPATGDDAAARPIAGQDRTSSGTTNNRGERPRNSRRQHPLLPRPPIHSAMWCSNSRISATSRRRASSPRRSSPPRRPRSRPDTARSQPRHRIRVGHPRRRWAVEAGRGLTGTLTAAGIGSIRLTRCAARTRRARRSQGCRPRRWQATRTDTRASSAAARSRSGSR